MFVCCIACALLLADSQEHARALRRAQDGVPSDPSFAVFLLLFLIHGAVTAVVQIQANITWFAGAASDNTDMIAFVNSNFPRIAQSRVAASYRDVKQALRNSTVNLDIPLQFSFNGTMAQVFALGLFFMDDAFCFRHAPVIRFDSVVQDMEGFRLERYGSRMSRTRAALLAPAGGVPLCPANRDSGVVWVRDPPTRVLPQQSVAAGPDMNLLPPTPPPVAPGTRTCLERTAPIETVSSAGVPVSVCRSGKTLSLARGAVELVFRCGDGKCGDGARLVSLELPFSFRNNRPCDSAANVSEWRCFELDTTVFAVEFQHETALRARFKTAIRESDVALYSNWPRDVDVDRGLFNALAGITGVRTMTIEHAFVSPASLEIGANHVLITWDEDVIAFYVNGTCAYAFTIVGPLLFTGRLPVTLLSTALISGTNASIKRLRGTVSVARLLQASVSREGADAMFRAALGLATPTPPTATQALSQPASESDDTVGIAVGVSVALVLIAVAVAGAIVAFRRRRPGAAAPSFEQAAVQQQQAAPPSDRQYGKLSIVEYARGDINLPPEI